MIPGPRSLKWQAVFVVVAALVLSHLISVTVYNFDRKEALTLSEAQDFAERVFGYVDIAAPATGTERQRILKAATSSFLTVTLDDARTPSARCRMGAIPPVIDRIMGDNLPPGFEWDICVLRGPDNLLSRLTMIETSALDTVTIEMLVRFPDGDLATFRARIPESPSFFANASLTYILFATFIVGAAAYWFILRVTRPLSQFGVKAGEIGKDLSTAPLPEEGPSEVIAAARAFNGMQTRLERLIRGRTEMLGAISHDLRTPITRLKLRVEMLRNETERDKLLSVLGDMEALVNAILDFVRGVNPHEETRMVDVAALTESLCADLAETGYPVTWNGPDKPALLPCRPLALKRCLQNLIDNALKYGGETSGGEASGGETGVCLRDTGTDVIIEVRDRGPGIPPEHAETVFQPFHRVETSRSRDTGGIGLGLPIASTIAHAHGGTLTLENRHGGGLTAKLVLPR